MKRYSVGVLAILAAVYGCATTEPEQTSSTPAATPSPTSKPSTAPGARAPVDKGAGVATGSGRPDLKRSVYYEFDKYDVKPEYRALVESHARWLKANPKAKLVIEGNADERGSREYNVALGQRRAEAVMKQIVLMGAKADQIEAISWGEEKPRRSGQDEASWSENRRDDFVAK